MYSSKLRTSTNVESRYRLLDLISSAWDFIIIMFAGIASTTNTIRTVQESSRYALRITHSNLNATSGSKMFLKYFMNTNVLIFLMLAIDSKLPIARIAANPRASIDENINAPDESKEYAAIIAKIKLKRLLEYCDL